MAPRPGMKLLCGIGINDTTDPVYINYKDGNKWWCPYYSCWYNMLRRVSGKYDTKKNESYKETKATEDFLRFSKFKPWMVSQKWEGNSLDKDIFGDGSLYSFETCCFIPDDVNAFLTGLNTSSDRLYGVSYRAHSDVYTSAVRYKGILNHMGCFPNKYLARASYVEKKLEFWEEVVVEHKLSEEIANAVRKKYQTAYDDAICLSKTI